MASSSVEFLKDNESKFKEADYLNDEASKDDPENEPYKSKYAAREIWHELRIKLDDIIGDDDSNCIPCTPHVILRGALDVKLGVNYAETEELSTGEEILGKCLRDLGDFKMKPEACGVFQRALNEMGILWSGRKQPDKAKEYLLEAKQLYHNFKNEVGSAPHAFSEVFEVPSEEADHDKMAQRRTADFESAYTHTLYYLAQIYVQLGDSDAGAMYCHETLKRQLDSMKYDPFDWAMNAATLSQYYMTNEDYTMSRHCLACAELILREFGEKPESLIVEPMESESNTELVDREKLPKSWADLFRCYTKYALSLLEYSRDKLYADLESHNDDNENAESEDAVSKKKNFFNLEVTAIENQITDKPLLDFDDARKVFLAGQKWITSAKEFYCLDGHCTDHVEVIQDHSHLYRALAFFEQDLERQCKMHKRRVDMLQDILKQISPQFYLMIYRQVQFELGETFSEMLDNKLAMLEMSEQPPTQHAVRKINSLCLQSIEQFQNYVTTLNDSKTKAPPEKYSEEDERPVLVAHFRMGRLYSKILVFDAHSKVQNIKKSADEFKFLVDYCEKNPSARNKVATELELCKEMIVLLPAKMDKIRAEAMN